jgi:hypothetical protein
MSNNNITGDKKLKVGTFDELGMRELHELEQMASYYKDKIRNGRRAGETTRQLEVELTYVQRELEIREKRALFAEKMNMNRVQNG